MTVNKNIARLAEGIRTRREPDTADGEPGPMDLLRGVARADSDASLARIAQRNTPTTKEN